MSGTSFDGVDAALVEIQGEGIRSHVNLLFFKIFPYSADLVKRIKKVSLKGTVDEICHLNFLLGEIMAQAALFLMEEACIRPKEVDLIGSHGQTLYHIPEPIAEGNKLITSTLQVGEPSIIAQRTGITTVADFRPRDMAAGGQGAPLAPYFHYIFFKDRGEDIIVQNIGGISNLTFIPSTGSLDDVMAFDTGPGTSLIDGAMARLTNGEKTYDEDGKWASQGKAREDLLEQWMREPFISKTPPKSTGRETFGEKYLDSVFQRVESEGISGEDIMATLTEFTVRSIAYNYNTFLFNNYSISEVVLSGGGAKNLFILESLKEKFPGLKISTFNDYGFPAKAVEAAAFAFLSKETFEGRINNLPKVTGAKEGVILGKIIPGKRFKGSMFNVQCL